MNDYNGTGQELQLKYVKNVNMLPAQWREEKERLLTKGFTKREVGKKEFPFQSINKCLIACNMHWISILWRSTKLKQKEFVVKSLI